MIRELPKHELATGAAMLCLLLLCGCGRWRVPAIDPTGQRIFAPGGTTTIQPRPLAGFGRPAFAAPPAPGPCLDLPPTLPPTTAPVVVAPPVAAPPAALPTAPPPINTQVIAPALPMGQQVNALAVGQRGSIVLSPTRLIAPVGNEVVLKAGLCGGDGRYVTDMPMEWVLSQESVGHLVAVGDRMEPRFGDRLIGANTPGHRDASFAAGRTSTRREVVRPSAADGSGPVRILSGQSWVSVTSLAEGVSRVAAMAPGAPHWDGQRQTAVIEWIDAQWSAPAPAIVRSTTQHTLTTSVTRSTDGTPLVGWVVRYEILDGPPAQFVSYEGITGVAADATTDSNGQASVTISPTTNQAGTTRVRLQILRPASPDGSRAAIAVGDAQTSVTWSAPGLSANIVGPQQVSSGQAATYHIEVRNPGDMRVTNVSVTHVLSPEMSYLGSDPPGQVFGNRVQWTFPVIDPGMVMAIDVSCRADGGGDVAHLVSVTCNEGLAAEASTVTRVFQNGLSVRMTGPVSATADQPVTFEVAVTNAGSQPVTNVLATDDLGGVWRHETGVPRIERPLGDLGPGETVEFPLTLMPAQIGELCHALSVTGDGGQFASTRACVMVTAPQAAPAAPARPPEPSYALRVESPDQALAGQVSQFNVVVTNTGTMPLTNLRVTSRLDPQLVHTLAEPGFLMMAGGIYWNIPQLPVGHQVAMRVQARCNAAAPRACHYATAVCDQLGEESAEGCLQIAQQSNRQEPTPATVSRDDDTRVAVSPTAARHTDEEPEIDDGLRVRLSLNGKSILVGQPATCLIEIHNERPFADQNVQLVLNLPPELRLERIIDAPAELRSSAAEDGVVTFEPIRELRAGERVTFRVQLRSRQSGRAALQASADSRRQSPSAADEAILQIQ